MIYLCGKCGRDVNINPGEPIRCKNADCDGRIFFKKRSVEPRQFIAR